MAQTQSGPGQSTTSATGPDTHMGVHVTAQRTRRHRSRQPIGQGALIPTATADEPMPGCKTALIRPDEHCPSCGYRHAHRAPYPPPATVTRRTRCGKTVEYAVRRVPAIKTDRGRAA